MTDKSGPDEPIDPWCANFLRCGLELCLSPEASSIRGVLEITLPYAVHALRGGRLLILNCCHKPLAVDGLARVDYESDAFSHLTVGRLLTPVYGCLHGPGSYFFGIANEPWTSRQFAEEYVARVEQCFGIRVKAPIAAFDRAAANQRFLERAGSGA